MPKLANNFCLCGGKQLHSAGVYGFAVVSHFFSISRVSLATTPAVPEKPQPAPVALLQLLLPDQATGPRQLQLQLPGRQEMDPKVMKAFLSFIVD